MDLPLTYEFLAILLFVLANGFFALSEFSIIASRKSKLTQEAERGKPGAVAAKELHSNPEKFLASIQVGITMFSALAGVLGGATVVEQLEGVIAGLPIPILSNAASTLSVVVVAVGITVVSVILGELVPKYLALSNPERYAARVARPILSFVRFSSFFSGFLSAVANGIVRLLGVKPAQSGSEITEEEINLMIYEGRKKGVFDDFEEKLIRSVFHFADSTVRRAMTPRTDVIAIDINTPPQEILKIITSHGYSRYPIFGSTVDNIKGILYTKDLIYNRVEPHLVALEDLIRAAFFVPDSMPLSKLLGEFQKRKAHVAIVLDEFGGTAGIITVEDILEELVGEIQDEYDSESPPLVKQSDNVAFADGSVWPGDVNEMLGTQLPEEDSDTLAGLVMEQLDRLPEENEEFIISDTRISVLKLSGNRLQKLKLERLTPDDDKKEEDRG